MKRFESLGTFLSQNQEVLLKPGFFGSTVDSVPTGDSFTLRSATYKTSETNRKDAAELAKLLHFNEKEVLRVISQITARIPEPSTEKKEKAQIAADKAERQQLYLNGVLKERRIIYKLVRHILTNDSHPVIGDKYSSQLLESPQYISDVISTLDILMKSLESPAIEETILTENLYSIVELLKVLSTLLLRVSTTPKNVILWFDLWRSHEYFTTYKDCVRAELYNEITSLVSVTSLLFFGLNTSDDCIDVESPYLSDSQAVKSIHDLVVSAPHDPLVLYTWGLLLFTLPEIARSAFTGDEDPELLAKSLTAKAAELDIFGYITNSFNILKYDSLYPAVIASFLICTVPFVQFTDTTTRTYLAVLKESPNIFVERFFENSSTQKHIYILRAKFPQIIAPYLRILSMNGGYAHSQLSNMCTYMCVGTSGIGYKSDLESDKIILTSELFNNPPYEQSPDVLLQVQVGTEGRLLPTADQNTEAVILNYNYNGWSLVGRILQNIIPSSDHEDLLLTILELISNSLAVADIDSTSEILENLSSYLDDSDILDVLLKLFETALHQRNVLLSTKLVDILIALVDTYPQIVWSHLVRSDLLEHGGRGGLIGTILGSVETITGNYEFTINCLRLFNKLITSSVLCSDGLDSHRVEVIPKFTTHASQVFESFMYWSFKYEYQKFEIGTLIIEVFSKILLLVYGIAPDVEPSKKVTSTLAVSARRILTSFTVSLSDVRIITPLIVAIESLNANPTIYNTSGRVGYWLTQWTIMCADFARVLVSLRSNIRDTSSTLEKNLFAKSRDLVMIYSKHYSLRVPVLQLLTQLVSAKWSSDVPSLISYMGDYYTDILLSAISLDLQFLYDDFKTKKYIYLFFSSVIEGHQKGLAMRFLNGRDMKNTEKQQKTLLGLLKVDLKNLDYYPEWLSIHLVDSIACAYNTWSLKGADSSEDASFIKTLVPKLSTVDMDLKNEVDSGKVVEGCYKQKLNSRVAEICALIIYSSTTDSMTKPIFDFLNSNDILKLTAPLYSTFDYNRDLHKNLSADFNAKWPAYTLPQFVRSPLTVRSRYGDDAVYDLRLLDVLLGDDPHWIGTGITEGMRDQVISASLNFQYVTSQISAAKSWGALMTSYLKKVPITSTFSKIAARLLQANVKEDSDVSIFTEVRRIRLELSFFFLYSLTQKTSISDQEIEELLRLSIELIVSHDADFLQGVSSQRSDVYRPLLRIISNLLSHGKANSRISENLFSELLGFSELVIAKGTTVLLEAIQTGTDSVDIGGRIEDLLLIMSIFKELIATKPCSNFLTKLSTLFVDFNTLKSILNVYSNAHTLKVGNDSVFAEISLTYIIELISVDVIAEQLITTGLFSTLIQSPLSMVIQEGSIFVHVSPKLHNIWTNGLMPIILILLNNFGVRLLPEISTFVNQFSKQFTTTIQSWSQDSVAITIPALQETEQIIVLQKALVGLYREFAQTHPGGLSEPVEIIAAIDSAESRAALDKSLKHLLAHPKYLTSRVVPTSLEEQKLFEGDDKVRTKLVQEIVSQTNGIQDLLAE